MQTRKVTVTRSKFIFKKRQLPADPFRGSNRWKFRRLRHANREQELLAMGDVVFESDTRENFFLLERSPKSNL